MATLEHTCPACGRRHRVTASQAGLPLDCGCGRTIQLPSLGDLRRLAGMAAYEQSVSQAIRQAVANGTLPTDSSCLECRRSDARRRSLTAVCELGGARTQASGGESGPFIAGLIAGIPFILPLGSNSGGEIQEVSPGRNVTVPMPACICDECWRGLPGFLAARACRFACWLSVAGAVGLFLSWLMAPAVGLATPAFWWLSLPVAGGALAWGAKVWFQRRREAALKSLLGRGESLYGRLLEEYPDASLDDQEPPIDNQLE